MSNYTTSTPCCQEAISRTLEELLLDIVTLFGQKYGKPAPLMDFAIVKDYGKKRRLILMSADPANRRVKPKEEWQANDKKLWNSISRARSKILELGLCNEWEYFATFTIDKRKFDRYNLDTYFRVLGQWLQNISKRTGQKIDYVLIPELHKDGAWHIHGLISGVTADKLTPFEAGKHPQKLIDGGFLNWKDYEKKFGFCSFGKIKDAQAVSFYVTKYVTKSLMTQTRRLGSRLYYCTQGLKRSEELIRGRGVVDVVPADILNSLYIGEYCASAWLN